ncbi:type I polyketide synthase [Chitinophaga japonensis]|uniref:Polyketide-type polyunsaturated fatty acid synthase PfaA n=1 Tax=Chitinophaga japonensis TaxID=104662 RepID=A0A562T707_CHIJA|nr:type I polyketide synthase [Chitinophaga japonensis]TWI89327.1 polyketide-type polyunsaturated fatty acid synthase PfaA [Chitinophaga japonensis]
MNIIGVTPFEKPDAGLALALAKAKAFPVIHLGRDKALAAAALSRFTAQSDQPFGVCFAGAHPMDISLPEQVTLAILPYGMKVSLRPGVQIYYQVHSIGEAHKARAAQASGIIVKGNEGAGQVSDESSFILFQRVAREVRDVPIWVQGGAGIHTAAALYATGAAGVVLDSQLVLFPECQAPAALKSVCEKLNGNETRVIDHFRVLVRPHSPALPEQATQADLEPYLHTLDLDKGYLPLGQDIAIGIDLAQRYKKLGRLVFALQEAAHGHLHQAKTLNVLSPGNPLSKELGIPYPIAQGPMTRVSDVPAFAAAVADDGGLPFVALSLLKGEQARQLILHTKSLAGNRPWGVGILGFAPPELREEQISYIKEERPPIVLIAGGRPSQAKALEQAGIKTFLHVPSASLLDMFIKEGARRFVFEGRECGGHVGPLSSMVLWERQVERLLQEEHAGQFSIFFAGGIHDALSAAFVSVLAAPLAAKGARIGVLMGTAYIYTREAVSSGAILQQFQEQAMEHKETVLLETAPGHETRCLYTPFADFFNAEKTRLQLAGTDKKEIWALLEQLNVGRLRIAAKGMERRGDALVKINAGEQLQAGMYMIGQVAALRDRIISIAELHKVVAEDNFTLVQQATPPPAPRRPEKALDVAIVGMACIYPGARNIEEYWRNIILGKDCITEVPDERWNKALYFDPAATGGEKSPSKWGGFIPKIDFDPVAFGIPPQSLAAIDPAQLLSLLVAKQALDNAGYGSANINRENVSVIIGAEAGTDLANNYGFRSLFTQVFGEVPPELHDTLPKLTEDSFPGVLANVIAGRITNRLDLGGRNYTVDAACASSLAAIDLACQELILEKSDMVIAGAADLHNSINDYLMFASTHALSRKGKCATFDADADGIALGEGVAMVVLKRYEDAQRDGDTIYAVIKGVGGSSDGKSLGLTAPRKAGQTSALERAYEQAGISPAAAGLVEAHGTGTVVGDRTELSAISDLLVRSGATAAQTHLGSVKTQIGHTKCAAGLAGLIKAALSVYHGVKPPTLHLQTPNGFYDPAHSPFAFNTQAGLWNADKRIAGISAFGFGGTNFHAVIENHSPSVPDTPVISAWPAELLVFRGRIPDDVQPLLQKVKTLLENNDNIQLKDIAYSLYTYNALPVQLCIVADSTEDLLLKLDLALTGVAANGIYPTQPVEGKVAFLFPGQGSQRVDMARDLLVAFPAMRRLLKDKPHYEQVLFPAAAFDPARQKEQRTAIRDTRRAQPLLGMVDLAIATFLQALGIAPDMLAGHSYGELPALCFAGVFAEDQLVPLSEKRAAAILDAVGDDKGAMLAVSCKEEVLTGLTWDTEDIWLVNHNSPLQWVVAGTTPAIARLAEKLQGANIYFQQLEVACAFHSPLLARAKELYHTAISDAAFREPSIPVWSNTTAAVYPSAPDAIRERLAEHLVQPVKFAEEIEQMYAQGARIFIETGPGKVLSNLTRAIIGDDELILHTEDKDQPGITHLLHTIARYMASGRPVQMEKLFEGRNAGPLDLDAPEQYKKSSTVWLVNGQMAVPATGKLPAHGALPITTPLRLKGAQPNTVVINQGGAEQMVEAYLNSVKHIVQAQRDVILGYLGHTPQHFNTAPLPDLSPAQPIPPAAPLHASGNGSSNGHAYTNGSSAPQPAPAAGKDVKEILLAVISDKTGYPPDMLGMEMDLEADLSIDSIKRMEIIGELRTRLGGFRNAAVGEETLVEQLAAIKTLKGLVDWITENATEAAALNTTSNILPPASSIPPPASNIPLQASDIQTVLLNVVSEKTGYPPDMLGLELDLEADLSIDSIKRMEIIGELKTRLGGLQQNGQQAEEQMEQLAAIKTLQGLIQWLAETSAGQFEPVQEAKKIIEQGFVNNGLQEKLSRMRFELTPSLLQANAVAHLEGYAFAVTDDGGPIATAIKNLLEQQGASVTIIREADPLEGYHGLIILDIFSSPQRPDIISSFSLVKKLDFDKVKWVYAISDFDGHLGQADLQLLQHFQGYTGFFKSLDKEYEHTKCRTINLANKLSPEKIAAIALDEILHPEGPSEVIYHNDARQTREPVPSRLTIGNAPDIHLDKQSVILVLGGAQGITSELMIRFSKEYPCHYILVGRSADPRKHMQDQYAFLKSKDEIRQYLVAQGQLKKPADIEKKTAEIHKYNQILHTITALEQNGATVAYHSLDLRDEAGLRTFIHSVYKEYGRIDGVVHGAGLLEDKLFHQKTPESFERVFSTKVTPLRVLAEQLNADTQFVILFSSVASVYGNRGQTDYAAANSVMDRYARVLKQQLNAKVMAINWGPWKGTGMVSPSLEKEYERRGIALIPLPDGMETFIDELKYGNESQVVIMAGSMK